MKPRKKNSFWTFILSFVPGAAEMYMGFMKSGLSILTIFVLPIIVVGLFYSADYIGLISGIMYVVAFFHARNMATAPDEEFDQLEDICIWEELSGHKYSIAALENYKKWIAYGLILLGIGGIWGLIRDSIFETFSGYFNSAELEILDSVFDSVPRLVFAVFIIVIGILLIKGKKKELMEEQENGEIVYRKED